MNNLCNWLLKSTLTPKFLMALFFVGNIQPAAKPMPLVTALRQNVPPVPALKALMTSIQVAALQKKTTEEKAKKDFLPKLHNHALLNECDCIITASTIVSRFAEKDFKPIDPDENETRSCYRASYAHRAPLITSTCFRGRYDHFSPTLPVAQLLMGRSDKPQNMIFYINIGCNLHAFIIQKFSDGKTTWWTCYESFIHTYSLKEWLSTTPLQPRRDDPTRITLHRKYGSQKLLDNPKQVLALIDEQILSISERDYGTGPIVTYDGMPLHIKMYTAKALDIPKQSS